MRQAKRSDTELVLAAQADDRQAFGELFDRWFNSSWNVARTVLRNDEQSADVAQDAMLAAWQGLDRLEDPDAFGGWLLRITRNRALNKLERENRSKATGDDVVSGLRDAGLPDPTGAERLPTPDSVSEARDHQELVWAAAAALGEREASLLDLHLRHGLTPAELATELGVEPNNAHQQLYRLRGKLGDAVGSYLLWRNGRPLCEGLAAAVSGQVAFDRSVAKAVSRHQASCDECSDRRSALVDPGKMFAAAPLVLVPTQLKLDAAAALQSSGVLPSSGVPVDGAQAPGSHSHFDGGAGVGNGTGEAGGAGASAPNPDSSTGDVSLFGGEQANPVGLAGAGQASTSSVLTDVAKASVSKAVMASAVLGAALIAGLVMWFVLQLGTDSTDAAAGDIEGVIAGPGTGQSTSSPAELGQSDQDQTGDQSSLDPSLSPSPTNGGGVAGTSSGGASTSSTTAGSNTTGSSTAQSSTALSSTPSSTSGASTTVSSGTSSSSTSSATSVASSSTTQANTTSSSRPTTSRPTTTQSTTTSVASTTTSTRPTTASTTSTSRPTTSSSRPTTSTSTSSSSSSSTSSSSTSTSTSTSTTTKPVDPPKVLRFTSRALNGRRCQDPNQSPYEAIWATENTESVSLSLPNGGATGKANGTHSFCGSKGDRIGLVATGPGGTDKASTTL